MGFMDTIRASLGSGKASEAISPPAPLRTRAPRPTERSIRARFIGGDRVSQVRRESEEERELRSRDAGAAAMLYMSITPAASHPQDSRQRIALPEGMSHAALKQAAEQQLRQEFVNGRRGDRS
jgi:hypothetical protein